LRDQDAGSANSRVPAMATMRSPTSGDGPGEPGERAERRQDGAAAAEDKAG